MVWRICRTSMICRLAAAIVGLVILAGAGLPVSAQRPAQPRPAEQPIWSGASAGYAIQWTTGDLTARSSTGAADAGFSVRLMARKDFADIEKDADSACEYVRTFRLLSVVGSIVSYEDDYGLSCERQAHPDGRARFVAVDLAKAPGARRDSTDEGLPPQVVSLTDYFPATDLLKALLADALVRKALDGASPRTLAELLAYLKENFPSVADDEKQCYELDPDILTRFAFHHIEGNKVAVRIGLSGTPVCRDNLTQIGLLLPIPPKLKEALEKAAAASEGFLMNRKIGAGRETTASFQTRKRPARH